jgi:hypothetical protein
MADDALTYDKYSASAKERKRKQELTELAQSMHEVR